MLATHRLPCPFHITEVEIIEKTLVLYYGIYVKYDAITSINLLIINTLLIPQFRGVNATNQRAAIIAAVEN